MHSSTPTLDGPRIRLEPLTESHLDQLEAIAFDDRIWRYMLSRIQTREDLRQWIDSALKAAQTGTTLPWVTILKSQKSDKSEDRIIGSTRFLDLDLTHKTTELGHTWLSPAYHGTGLNAEAKLLQLRYAFDDLNLNRVALKTHHENLQSQAAMRKIGAKEEGTFRNHYIMPDGTPRHSVWFSITREDWPQIRSSLEQLTNPRQLL